MKIKTNSLLVALLVILVAIAISFGLVAGFIYLICWCFGIDITMKVVLGIYLLCVLVSALFK